MSNFSTLLEELVHAKRVNVNGLSSYCGMDRSTMYKLINGTRNPGSFATVRKITEYLHLTPVETREITEAYEITRLGHEVYYSRKDILEFILNFQDIQNAPQASFAARAEFSFFEAKENALPLNGRISILSALHNIVLQEASGPHGEFCILAQPEHLESLGLIPLLSISCGILSIRHVICINNASFPNRSRHNYNLQCLKRIIPFYGIGCQYKPAYYYDNMRSHFSSFNFMPCIFLTRQSAVIFDYKMNNGFFLQGVELLKPIHRQFQEIWNRSAPLMRSFELSPDSEIYHFPDLTFSGQRTYILGFEPCVSACLTPDFLGSHLSPMFPNRDTFLRQCAHSLQILSKNQGSCYFSLNGLRYFLESGYLYEVPKNFFRPLNKPERIQVLKKFRMLSGSGKNIRMFRGALEGFPPNFHLIISPGTGYLIFVNQKNQYFYLLLEEQNLLRAFYDFASSLDDSGLIYSPEDTDKYLKETINSEGGLAKICQNFQSFYHC